MHPGWFCLFCLGLILYGGSCERKAKIKQRLELDGQAKAEPTGSAPKREAPDDPIRAGQLTLLVKRFGPAFVVTSTHHGCAYVKSPMYVVDVEVANRSDRATRYFPSHTEEAPDAHPVLIDNAGVRTAPVQLTYGSRFIGQTGNRRTLKPGVSTRDRFVYECPRAQATEVVWTVPTHVFGTAEKLLVALSNPSCQLHQPQPSRADRVLAFGQLRVHFLEPMVDHASLERRDEVGCSKNAYLMLRFEIRNLSDKPFVYRPMHHHPKSISSRLEDDRGNRLGRAFYASEIKVRGQSSQSQIPPGGAVDDMLMFDLPQREARKVVLDLCAQPFGAERVIRVQFPVKFPDKIPNKCGE